MILTGFLVAFAVSSCWAANGSSSDQDVPFVVASPSDANEEIPFVVASQSGSDEEIPFVVASQGNSDEAKASNLLPESGRPDAPPPTGVQWQSGGGRSDVPIEDDETSGGYFYPKPSKPFDLPHFTTLDASASPNVVANFAEDNAEIERLPRSPRRRPPYDARPPPPFIPGFIPPHNIRPLPALYGGPLRY